MNKGVYPFLDVQRVVKKFGGLVANNKVSLQVRKGEIRGLIGPNGSGKTTLINVITGIYEPDEGNIFYAGKRIDGLQPDVVASLGIMRTFQVARVFRDMTVLENMLIPAFCQGQSRKDAVARAEELLLQIVRGFMNRDLQLYVMDEPFAGVHQSIKGIILKSIRIMNAEKGITFLIISHEMPTVSTLCEKVTVLAKGELIAEGTMEQVANEPQVIDAYLGG